MQRKFFKWLPALVSIILLTAASQALLPDISREELILRAESIVFGEVLKVSSSWNQDRSGIFTYVTLKVESQFKGEPAGREIIIQVPGGTAGDITQKVSDTPSFSPGMRVILHLFKKETGYFWIYGWEKGALQVIDGEIPAYRMSLSQFNKLVQSTTR